MVALSSLVYTITFNANPGDRSTLKPVPPEISQAPAAESTEKTEEAAAETPAAETAAAPASDATVAATEEAAPTRTADEVSGGTEAPDAKKAKVIVFSVLYCCTAVFVLSFSVCVYFFFVACVLCPGFVNIFFSGRRVCTCSSMACVVCFFHVWLVCGVCVAFITKKGNGTQQYSVVQRRLRPARKWTDFR